MREIVVKSVINDDGSPVQMYAVAPGRPQPTTEDEWKQTILTAIGRAADIAEDVAIAKEAKEAAVDAAEEAVEAKNAAVAAEEQVEAAIENAEAWAVGQKDGQDVPSTDPTYHNNSKYYAEQAAETIDTIAGYAGDAEDSAEDSEAYAVGKRDGTDVGSSDPAYHNNSKYYSEQASSSATSAGNSSSSADGFAKDAEAYAIGKRSGVDVSSSDPAYHNNSKYWSDQAFDAKTDAVLAKIAAENAAAQIDNQVEDAESWAKGTRRGVPVESTDPAYHKNSKYYADSIADAASQAQSYAGDASGYASSAEGFSKDSEAYAIGKRGGTDVSSADPAYHNNAKYWSDQAAASAANCIDDTAGTGSTNKAWSANKLVSEFGGKLDKTGGTLTGKLTLQKGLNPFATGTGTAGQAGSATDAYIPSLWTFNLSLTPAAGDVLAIKVPVAGVSSGVWMSVNNGTTYYPVALNGKTRFTTHFGADEIIILVFETGMTTTTYGTTQAGDVAGATAADLVKDRWSVVNFYDTNTTYSSMSSSELTAGTATSKRVLTAANMKAGIKDAMSAGSTPGHLLVFDKDIEIGGNPTAITTSEIEALFPEFASS